MATGTQAPMQMCAMGTVFSCPDCKKKKTTQKTVTLYPCVRTSEWKEERRRLVRADVWRIINALFEKAPRMMESTTVRSRTVAHKQSILDRVPSFSSSMLGLLLRESAQKPPQMRSVTRTESSDQILGEFKFPLCGTQTAARCSGR